MTIQLLSNDISFVGLRTGAATAVSHNLILDGGIVAFGGGAPAGQGVVSGGAGDDSGSVF